MGLFINSVHAAIISFGILILWISQPGTSLFSFHPALMTLGLMVVALEGVLLMKDHRVPLRYRITVHWACEVAGVLLAYLGFLAIYNNKENNKAAHFTTWHGQIGLITLGLLSMAPMGGVVAKYSQTTSKLVGLKPRLLKDVHGYAGIAALVSLLFTVILSFYSNWFQAVVSGNTWWIALGLAIYPRLYFGYLRAKNL